jgi:hypothetical protein
LPSKKAVDLLERMRHSKAGWKRKDLDTLYGGFGFVIRGGKSHDIVSHPDYPHLRDTLPRSKRVLKAYVKNAIRLIEELQRLQTEDKQHD